MKGRSWTLRPADLERGLILAITANEHQLDEIAEHLASHGFYAFAALPHAVPHLCAVAVFDVAVIFPDVSPADRERLEVAEPPVGSRLVVLAAGEQAHAVDRIRERLSHS